MISGINNTGFASTASAVMSTQQMNRAALMEYSSFIVNETLTQAGNKLGMTPQEIQEGIRSVGPTMTQQVMSNLLEGLPPFERARLDREVGGTIRDAINGMDPSLEGKSVLEKIAIILGRILDDKMGEMLDTLQEMEQNNAKEKAAKENANKEKAAATQAGAANATEGQAGVEQATQTNGTATPAEKKDESSNTNELSSRFQAESKIFDMLSNMVNNVIKTLGQSLSTMARK